MEPTLFWTVVGSIAGVIGSIIGIIVLFYTVWKDWPEISSRVGMREVVKKIPSVEKDRITQTELNSINQISTSPTNKDILSQPTYPNRKFTILIWAILVGLCGSLLVGLNLGLKFWIIALLSFGVYGAFYGAFWPIARQYSMIFSVILIMTVLFISGLIVGSLEMTLFGRGEGKNPITSAIVVGVLWASCLSLPIGTLFEIIAKILIRNKQGTI